MQLDLTGKNAFVGGSSQGIGRAVAHELALLGATVTVCARSEDKLRDVLASLDRSQGQQHSFVAVDFSDEKLVEKAASALAAERTIHILVNNTGGPPAGQITGASPADFLAAFDRARGARHGRARDDRIPRAAHSRRVRGRRRYRHAVFRDGSGRGPDRVGSALPGA